MNALTTQDARAVIACGSPEMATRLARDTRARLKAKLLIGVRARRVKVRRVSDGNFTIDFEVAGNPRSIAIRYITNRDQVRGIAPTCAHLHPSCGLVGENWVYDAFIQQLGRRAGSEEKPELL